MSTNTGVPPAATTELADATKVNEGKSTSSPSFNPHANNAANRADVPEFTAITCLMLK